jgi:hypothetical protein
VALNLTKRQIICFGAGLVFAVPMFFLTKKGFGVEGGALLCMVSASPFFLLGMYEKNGVPAEKLFYYSIRRKYLRPQIRKKDVQNRFEKEENLENVRKEIARLERKAANGGTRKRNKE